MDEEQNINTTEEAKALNNELPKEENNDELEKLAEDLDKGASIQPQPKKDLEEETKIINDPAFIQDIMKDLNMEDIDPELMNALMNADGGDNKMATEGTSSIIPLGNYEAKGTKFEGILKIVDGKNYEYTETIDGVVKNQKGTYRFADELYEEELEFEPRLPDSVFSVCMDKEKNTLKIETKSGVEFLHKP